MNDTLNSSQIKGLPEDLKTPLERADEMLENIISVLEDGGASAKEIKGMVNETAQIIKLEIGLREPTVDMPTCQMSVTPKLKAAA